MVETEIVTHADLVKQVVDKLPFNVPKAIAEATAWADRLSDPVLQHLADQETSVPQLVKIYREMRNAEKDPEAITAKQQAQARIAEVQAARIWDAFYFRHPEVPDNQSMRQRLAERSLSLSDGSTPWFQHLDGAASLLLKEGFIKLQEIKQPLTAANLKNDEQTLRKYCRDNRLQFNTAALNRLRELYGGNFKVVISGTQDRIEQAIRDGSVHLGPADDDQIAQWDAEDREAATQARNEWLINDSVDLEQRKTVAKEILADSRNQAVEEQATRELESAKARHDRGRFDGSPYPLLPPEIDRKAIFAADAKTLRGWIDRFGDYQISARVRGIQ